MTKLLTAVATTDQPETFVRRNGTVVAQFDHRTQDSGNVSWVVETDVGDLFVKTAGAPDDDPDRALVPYLDHDGRVALLRNAIDLARSCDHPSLARLRSVVDSPWGPILVYERAPGELIGTTRDRRTNPTSAYQRFAHLPADRLLGVFDALLDVHRAVGHLWMGGIRSLRRLPDSGVQDGSTDDDRPRQLPTGAGH